MNKKNEDLQSLKKEELIKKILNQKESLSAANKKIKELSKKLELYEIAESGLSTAYIEKRENPMLNALVLG